MAVTEGDTLKPAIDAGCAIAAENGMTPAHPTARATTTLARHAPPARKPQRAWQHPRRRLERRRPGPARACDPSREGAYAPRAPADAIECAWPQNDVSTYRIGARSDHDASQGDTDSSAGFDVLQRLIRYDPRAHA